MKLIKILFVFTYLIIGCKKQSTFLEAKKEDPIISSAKLFLEGKLSKEDFNILNWSKVKISTTPDKKKFLTIPVLPGKPEVGSCIFLYNDNLEWQGNWSSSKFIKNNDQLSYSGYIKNISLDKVYKKEFFFERNILMYSAYYLNGKKGSPPINNKPEAWGYVLAVLVTPGFSWYNLASFLSVGGGGDLL